MWKLLQLDEYHCSSSSQDTGQNVHTALQSILYLDCLAKRSIVPLVITAMMRLEAMSHVYCLFPFAMLERATDALPLMLC